MVALLLLSYGCCVTVNALWLFLALSVALSVDSSFAIVSLGNRELVAILYLPFDAM